MSITDIRDSLMSAIRGNAQGPHGSIACLRCKFLDNRINEIQQELNSLQGAATLHVVNAHNSELSPTRIGSQRVF